LTIGSQVKIGRMTEQIKITIRGFVDSRGGGGLSFTQTKALIGLLSELESKMLWDKTKVIYPFTMGQGTLIPAKINYAIGDTVMSSVDLKPLGVCTGFTPDNTCILIDGKCWGGKYYFEKYDGER